MTDFKLSYDDVSIIPERVSSISSRNECNPYLGGMLPIFASPMDTVVCEENIKDFLDNKINVVIPRTIPLERRIELGVEHDCFFAVSIKEAERIYEFFSGREAIIPGLKTWGHYKICIDIANGHMQWLLDVCKNLKSLENVYITLMTGNIANPETYADYEDVGVDYIRVGIGGGCFTGDSIVKTLSGNKKIKDIVPGEKVLTHTGEYKEVIDTFVFDDKDEIMTINDINCTPNHEFYVIDKENAHLVTEKNVADYAKWIPAEKLDKNKHLLIEL